MQTSDDTISVGQDFAPRVFTTVFDAGQQVYAMWWVPASGMILVVVSGLLVFRPALMQRVIPTNLQGTAQVIFSRFVFPFAMVWTAMSGVSTYRVAVAARDVLRSGQTSIVSGPVSNFVRMPYGGHAKESFTVGDRRFSYSDYILTAGFNNTASHGGPIRQGLYVRVTYAGDLILRLEIARP